jgi:hypothetical protein
MAEKRWAAVIGALALLAGLEIGGGQELLEFRVWGETSGVDALV